MWYEETALHNASEKKSPPRNTLRSWFSTDLKIHLSLTILSDAYFCVYTTAFKNCTSAHNSLHPERKETQAQHYYWGCGFRLPESFLFCGYPFATQIWGDSSGSTLMASRWNSLAITMMRWSSLYAIFLLSPFFFGLEEFTVYSCKKLLSTWL